MPISRNSVSLVIPACFRTGAEAVVVVGGTHDLTGNVLRVKSAKCLAESHPRTEVAARQGEFEKLADQPAETAFPPRVYANKFPGGGSW